MADEEKKDEAAEETKDGAAEEKKDGAAEEKKPEGWTPLGDTQEDKAVGDKPAPADEPKAEETPAKEEPKAEDAPKPTADTLGDEKGPSPLILAGAGAAVLALVIVIIVAVSGGGHPYDVPGTSPDLDGEEKVEVAAKSYLEFLHEFFNSYGEVRHDRKKAGFSSLLSEDFYEDPDLVVKERERQEKKQEFSDDHMDELTEEWKIEDGKESDEAGLKVWTCTVKMKSVKKSGDNDWKIEEEEMGFRFKFSKIDEEWKMVSVELKFSKIDEEWRMVSVEPDFLTALFR